jgi:hypothetical protein
MFSKLFGKKAAKSLVFAYAKINMPLKPIARGDLFEDPLDDQLRKAGLGETTGGGALLSKAGEIEYCGIDIEMSDVERAPAFICDALNRRGAPKGSELQFQKDGRKVVLPFGVAEGIAVYLNGTDLPDEVYKTCDVNVVIDTFNTLVEPETGGWGNVVETWQGPTETAIYMFGVSATQMRAAIAPILAEHALCQRARVVDLT